MSRVRPRTNARRICIVMNLYFLPLTQHFYFRQNTTALSGHAISAVVRLDTFIILVWIIHFQFIGVINRFLVPIYFVILILRNSGIYVNTVAREPLNHQTKRELVQFRNRIDLQINWSCVTRWGVASTASTATNWKEIKKLHNGTDAIHTNSAVAIR